MPTDWEIPSADDADDAEDEFGPDSADYDLSESHGYMWDPKRRDWPVPSWLLIVVSIVVIIALLLPTILIVR